MDIAKSFITDTSGSIKSVIIDYAVFKKIEQLLLDPRFRTQNRKPYDFKLLQTFFL